MPQPLNVIPARPSHGPQPLRSPRGIDGSRRRLAPGLAVLSLLLTVAASFGCDRATTSETDAVTDQTADASPSTPAPASGDPAAMPPADQDATAATDVQTELITYEHGGVTFEGLLAWNPKAPAPGGSASMPSTGDGDGVAKRPGVIVCHEWWGNNDYSRRRARDLADLGYVAFALDMYGKGNVTTSAEQAGTWARGLYGDPAELRARAEAAYEILRNRPEVDADRIAVIGYCFGGTVALELARTGADVDAIVCFHTSGLTATNPADNRNIKGRVLICHGGADPLVEPSVLEAFKQQMQDAGVPHSVIVYNDALHSFTNPAADKVGMAAVGYNQAADESSWKDMQNLFAETIDKPQN